AIGEVNGTLDSLSSAVSQALGGTANSSALVPGLHGLQHTLRDQIDGFYRPILTTALDPALNEMLRALSNQLSSDAPNFAKNVSNIVASVAVDLTGGIRQIHGTAGNVN